MSLMELIKKTAKAKSRDIIFYIINTLLLIIFFYLLFENSEIIYPLILSLSGLIIYFIIEVIKYRNFSEKLNDCKVSPSYIATDVTLDEEEILNIISDVHKEYLNRIHTLNQEIKERESLFSQWIHNMKTSITVIDLACENSDVENKYIEDIKEENNALKKNLEECLNVIRLDDFSRDYITSPYNLKALITEIINSKKRDFIYKGVFPNLNIDENIIVYTDRKWCAYMIEQILSNSIKYSNSENSKQVDILAKEFSGEIELVIRDKGIGITREDLPRVFDPFFTGNNGRKERSATGIGLYMVKIISKKLGHKVEINSELGIGTEVKIIFKNNIDVS